MAISYRLLMCLQAVISGDSRSLSIAAASVLAKVARDEVMRDLANTYPDYGWQTNAGYGTKSHQNALQEFGVTPHHRKSFAPIKNRLKIGPPATLVSALECFVETT